MSDVASLAGFSQTVALDGLGENDSGSPLVIHGRVVGRIDFLRVVSSPANLLHHLIAQMIHHFQQIRIGSEEVFPDVLPG